MAEARSSIHVVWESPREIRTEPVVSVNVLCLVGAMVGVVSLFLPWFATGEGLSRFDFPIVCLAVGTDVGLPVLVFITGTVVAFFFPAAFAAQAAGVLLFFLDFVDNGPVSSGEYYLQLAPGFYAGILSSMLVFAGLVHPMGPGYDGRWRWWSRRTEVSSKASFLGDRMVKQVLAMPREVVGALKASRTWVYAMVIVVSLITGLFLIGVQMSRGMDPVTVYDDGAMVIIGDAATYSTWDYADPALTDGLSTVNWSAEPEFQLEMCEVIGRELPTAHLGTQNLSGVALGLTVVDFSGDGRVTPGDLMFLTPSSGTPFTDGVSYEMTVAFDPYPARPIYIFQSVLLVEGSDGVIKFEFEGGEVASSSADGGLGLHYDDALFRVLVSLAIVACGSVTLGAAYYVPVISVRRRVLGDPHETAPLGSRGRG